MKFQNLQITLAIFIILIAHSHSQSQSQANAKQPHQPIIINLNNSDNYYVMTTIKGFINKTLQYWKSHQIKFQGNRVELSTPTVLAGVLCFIASSISSAGGIGGGGLYIPILTIVAGLDLKAASSFSAFMVTGGSIANVMYNLRAKSDKFGGKTLIDYDIALLSEPCMLLGVSVGVICNLVFPEWLITVLFAVFLAWSTTKTCCNGIAHWKMESQSQQARNLGYEKLENGAIINCGESTGQVKSSSSSTSLEEPMVSKELLGHNYHQNYGFPWKKLLLLTTVWFSFFLIYLFRGNRYGEGIIQMKPCGVGYWTLSLTQIPLAIAFTAWILRGEEATAYQGPNKQGFNRLLFPVMALLAGGLGGVFGIGGGMLISPLLLHVGVPPEVTAATCSFMVFFSSTMSAFQYLFLGMEHIDAALIFSIICFIGSLLGLLVVQRAIKEYGRASLIVFSVGIVMALSTILMTSFGALDVWEDYSSGNYMGFKLPC